MRITQLKSGAWPLASARMALSKNPSWRLTAFTAAGFIAGSAIAYALTNGGATDKEPTGALTKAKLAESAIELAALPQAGVSDAALFTAISQKPEQVAEAPSQDVLPPPAPERFGDALPETSAVTATQVASTDAEVLALELELAEAGDPNFVLPPEVEVAADNETEIASLLAVIGTEEEPVTDDMVPAEALRYVNLRQAPDNDSGVIRVVAAGDAILVEANCEGWCAVTHQGTDGYVYESFIGRTGG